MARTHNWQPMTGPWDNRSIPSEMPPLSYRRLLNVWVPSPNRLARRFGWEKLGHVETGYNNTDLHDQILSLQTYYDVVDEDVEPEDITSWPNAACGVTLNTRETGRQPLTMLAAFESTRKSRLLLAATESRIYASNEHNGNWRIIGDGLGVGVDDGTCPSLRFSTSFNMDTAIFVNDYDQVLYWIFGSDTNGCDQQAVRPIEELALIGLTRAAVTWTWKYVTFLANVEMDGQRFTNRIVWSDYQGPLSWDPAKPESIAGFQDLEYGEIILGGAEIADYFFIFTNKRIWQLSVKPDGTFNFNKRYTPDKTGDGCLYYKNTLVSTGKEIYYFGKDGLYSFSQYRPAPERLDGPYLASGDIFHESRTGTISAEWCNNHVAGYNSNTKEVLFSWVPDGSETGFPSRTFVFNVAYNHCSDIDHGFTAFAMYQPDTAGTFRDYLLDICACSVAQLATYGARFIKEGLPRSFPSGCATFNSLYTNVAVVVDGANLEDPDADPDDGALCHVLGRPEDLCGECPDAYQFIAACSVDWCLKQFTAVYSRERCTNPTATGTSGSNGYVASVGTYVLDGYSTRLTSMAMNFRNTRDDKKMRRFELEGVPELQDIPSTLYFRLGQSHQVVDPVDDLACGIIWHDQDEMLLECQSVSVSTHQSQRTRPNETFEWPMYYSSMYYYFDFEITGTGGGFQMSRISVDIEEFQKSNSYFG